MRLIFTFSSIIIVIILTFLGYFVSSVWFWVLAILLPFVIIGFYDMVQTKHAITRNFPLVGHSRFIAEWLRPKVFQYFIEPDTEGKPFSRIFRDTIYQRAKNISDTTPFGTQLDVYQDGYEWMSHSIGALDFSALDHDPRVMIGGKDCKQPYAASVLNVSAMSFGSLSSAAVMALNGGAALGGFAHNTGEGGISPYHNKHNGDLIYQIGTGYFGCRAADGNFDDELFKKRTAADNVKMIEIKLSQGAKPGHGGILPAKKVTAEIAEIRNIEMGKDVNSPPYHKAFNTPEGLLHFVKKCRELSGGKPVGFKLCVGKKHEFIAICKAMIKTGIKPDFIAVDGGEGGTGAAPLEFSNSVGMPLREGLTFVYDTLIGFNVKKDIILIAAGKVSTGFHIYRAISLGADICYSARAMMMAVGCIQALECNKNTCPTGVATQDPKLIKGLVVADKKERVYHFHKDTVKSFVELLAASGVKNLDELNRSHVSKRGPLNDSKTYEDIFPYTTEGCLLAAETVPAKWKSDWSRATPENFQSKFESVYIEED
jgi:glutamate synthase domain-containing protein 2